jgi:hypothetical protein
MRISLTAIVLLLAIAPPRAMASGPAQAADPDLAPIERRFAETVRPFLEAHCLACHDGATHKGDLDLSGYRTAGSVAVDLDRWEVVLDQLRSGAMPPAKAKRHPSAEVRREVVAWIAAVRGREAARNAGDPGPVPARRLSNAEYDHTIRDLTGVDLRPTREFPVDPANAAGFDNSAESLTMSPALVKKYLEAARGVADHLVLQPQGFAFAAHPVVADTDRDKYAVRRIIEFYRRQRTDLADYFQAAWRHRHREALGRPGDSLADFAAEAKLSPRYLATVQSILTEAPEEVGPIAALRALWDELPAPGGDRPDAARVGSERIRDFVVGLRRQLTPEVKNLTARGVQNGAQPLVLWKNRQLAANRMRYTGGASKIRPEGLTPGSPAARALAIPDDPAALARFEATFGRFCATFPDAFLVSERARVYLDPKDDKDNTGRLLSAGFHSMTGYFRDDAPLSDLLLDEPGRRELDGLWREFDFLTAAPIRQYASFLWFERTDSTFMRGAEFDFARAEDKDAGSEGKIRQLAEVYRAKAQRYGASEVALGAIDDYFRGISASIRWVEQARREAEPSHIGALRDFAGRAFRRPLSGSESDGIAGFYQVLRRQDGLSHEEAVRDSVVGILMSPHFCYRVDQPSGGPGIRPLSDFDLASRLSYFLWSSMPDAELMARAGSGDLQRPEVLVDQARRMLRDDRARGLATEFGGNWLDFRRFEEHNSVDRGRFPGFDDELRRAMFEEPVRFLLDVVREDRSVLDLLDADHTFVNPVLARHYGIPEPGGGPDGWSQVDGARRFGRGGLPPMAVFLTRNSPGLRTSPVKRGYWVVRRLLGEEIPAPPADVPDLPVDEARSERPLREALVRHRADTACAGCHARFDPIGLAFEGYGPVGEQRSVDLGGHPVDTRARFPGGQEGTGVDGLRDYLKGPRRDEFLDNLCRKLLAYALGRGLRPSDDRAIQAMRARLASEGHRFGGLVEVIVTSPQFRNRRSEATQTGG